MKYFSELTNKIYDTEQDLFEDERSITLEKDLCILDNNSKYKLENSKTITDEAV